VLRCGISNRPMSARGHFRQNDPASDALGMSASLRSRLNLRTAAIRRGVPEPDSCTAANIAASFEQDVGAQQKRFGNREAHSLRSLEIDGQLELRGLLYGQVFRLPAL
jgi:hypothetical protein